MQRRIRETAWMDLLNHLLIPLRRQLLKLLREIRLGCEDRCALGHRVLDVHDFPAAGAVPFEQGGNGFARGGSVGNFEGAFGVFVLRIDDDEG